VTVHHQEHGEPGPGEPLVLLHGIGETSGIWTPVLPYLRDRRVVCVDLPGFGGSAPVRGEPSPQRLAIAVRSLLDELGLDRPVVAGVSLGGWVALELAVLGRAGAVVAFSPAGLWADSLPAYSRGVLKALRTGSLHGGGRVVGGAPGGRALAFPNYARPRRIPAAELTAQLRSLAEAPGWDATLAAMAERRFRGGRSLPVPVTVAWGARDVLLPRRMCLRTDELPAGTRLVTLPGCGHTPTWDDPPLIAQVIARALPASAA